MTFRRASLVSCTHRTTLHTIGGTPRSPQLWDVGAQHGTASLSVGGLKILLKSSHFAATLSMCRGCLESAQIWAPTHCHASSDHQAALDA